MSCIKKNALDLWLPQEKPSEQDPSLQQQTAIQQIQRIVALKYPNTKIASADLEKYIEQYSLGTDRQNEFNWGHLYTNPSLVLFVQDVCKFVLNAEQASVAYITHKNYGQRYLDKRITINYAMGTMTALHLGLSLTYTISDIATLTDFWGKDKKDSLFHTSTRLIGHGTDFLHDLCEESNRLSFFIGGSKAFQSPSFARIKGVVTKLAGPVGVGMEMISVASLAASRLRSLYTDDVPTTLKAVAWTDTFLNGYSSISGSSATALWLYRLRKASELAERTAGNIKYAKALPIIGLATSVAAGLLKPLEIYSIHKEFTYSKEMAALAKKLQPYADQHNAYALLSGFYKEKATLDTCVTSAQSALLLIGGTISILAMASVIVAPIGLIAGMATALASTLIDIGSQKYLERVTSQKSADVIRLWEKSNPGKDYFAEQIDAHYRSIQNNLIKMLVETQKAIGNTQLIAVTQIMGSRYTRELAAIAVQAPEINNMTRRLGAQQKTYIELLKEDGIHTPNQQAATIDQDHGIINLDASHTKQILSFVTPLLSPGYIEMERRKDRGSSSSKPTTYLIMRKPLGWVINDRGAAAHTTIDLTNIIAWAARQSVHLVDRSDPTPNSKNTPEAVSITVNLGNGHDTVIMGTGATTIIGTKDINDGTGASYQVVNYSALNNAQLDISFDEQKKIYQVKKKLNDAMVVVERIRADQFGVGKNTETIWYRDTVSEKLNRYVDDNLSGIQKIIATSGNDTLRGGSEADTFDANDGDDHVFGGAGDDHLSGGAGKDKVNGDIGNDWLYQTSIDGDILDGGADIDTVDYSASQVGIYADLFKGTVQELGGTSNIVDRLFDIENFIGTQWHDEIHGNDQDNVLDGSGGNNRIYAHQGDNIIYAGDGTNTVYVGSGANRIRLGDGQNTIFVESANGNEGKNDIRVGNGNNMITTLGGADCVSVGSGSNRISTGGGKDIIQIRTLSTQQNSIDAGACTHDIVDYSQAAFEEPYTQNGIYVDLREGFVLKQNWQTTQGTLTTRPSVEGKDKLTNVEGIVGTRVADVLKGDEKDNLLDGGQGGNDYFEGRKGNDILISNTGNNTFKFSRGDGQDIIIENDGRNDDNDILELWGINKNAVHFKRVDETVWDKDHGHITQSNLRLEFLDTTDSITFENWFKGDAHHIETIRIISADGTSNQQISHRDVDALVEAWAQFSTDNGAGISIPTLRPHENALNAAISSNWK